MAFEMNAKVWHKGADGAFMSATSSVQRQPCNQQAQVVGIGRKHQRLVMYVDTLCTRAGQEDQEHLSSRSTKGAWIQFHRNP